MCSGGDAGIHESDDFKGLVRVDRGDTAGVELDNAFHKSIAILLGGVDGDIFFTPTVKL